MPSTCTLTVKDFVSDASDDFRTALNFIGRQVLTCKHIDPAYFYTTDLVYDALTLANMADGQRVWIIVTDMGTHLFHNSEEAREYLSAHGGDARTLIKIQCTCPTQEYLPRTWRVV